MMMSMASSFLVLAILGLLTSAAPVGKNNTDDVSLIRVLGYQGGVTQTQPQTEHKGRELQAHTDPLPARVIDLERNTALYRQAALSMAESDFFPVHLCGEDALGRMRQILSFIPHDELQRALVMTTFMQDTGCPRGAVHTATRLMHCVKNVTSQHRHNRAAQTDEAGRGGQTDHCSSVEECGWRGVAEVRSIMADEADLLLLYDTVAAGVFFAGGRSALAQALSEDLRQSLRVSNPSLSHQRFRRTSFSETDIHTVIEWIPIPYVGTLYNVCTAAYYYHLGNEREAESRLASAGLDIVASGAVRLVARGIKNPLVEEGLETLVRRGFKSAIGYK